MMSQELTQQEDINGDGHNLVIFSDGAYSPSNNQGGIGFVVLKNDEVIFKFSKMFTNTTNQRMEVLAATIALESIKNTSNITIITDSMYVVGTLMKGWKRKKNLDLWNRIDKAIEKHSKVDFIWTKGHADNKYNQMVDELAFNASKQIL